MKYKAIIDTDDYKDFEFFEDGNGKYLIGIDAGASGCSWMPLYFTECQEPVLDKVRAEISEVWHTKPRNKYEEGLKDQALKVMQIIDKYKAESENR